MLNYKLNWTIIISFILLFSQFLLVKPASADEAMGTVQLRTDENGALVSDKLSILEDKNKEWTVDDVRKGPLSEQFIHSSKRIPNFGYTTSAYWTRFQLKNNTNITNLNMEIDYPPIHKIDIYVFNESDMLVNEQHLGAKYPFDDRMIYQPDFLFPFSIDSGKVLTFYLRFETEGSMQMPIYIWNQSGLIMEKQQNFLLQGIFYGVTGIMVFYNLFLYLSLRHRSYLYYVFYIISIILVNLSLNGFAFQYLWPDSPWWNTRSIVFLMNIAAVTALLFANSFLNLRKQLPKARKMLIALIVFNLGNAVFVLFSYQHALNLMVVGYFGMIAFILSSAILCLKKGVRQTRFFIVGWCVVFIGVLLSLLADSGVIALSAFTKNAWQVSACFEIILLSLALADRINMLRADKEQAVLESQRNQELALENLKRSDKLKDEFLATTSHELRTPLHGIIGIAETLRDGATGKVSKDMYDHLSMIIASGKRLTNLVNDILDFSRLKNNDLSIELTSVDITELTNVALKICEPLAKKKSIKLINQLNASTPNVYADENRLLQIFYNLIGNAIKYMDSGEVIITAERIGDYLKITVSDNGTGIPSDQLEAIFDYFHQVDQDKTADISGTGIGLSITKQLVELHGGEIGVTSYVGIGSKFSFTMPISYHKAELLAETAASVTPLLSNSEVSMLNVPTIDHSSKETKILIADDEPVNLQVLSNQLILAGYEVITATNGEEVIERIRQNGLIDLLIVDIMMPKMSGIDVCLELRKDYTLMELPILMLTAKNQVHDKVTSFQVGANDYLVKPCEKQELLARVKTLIQLKRINQELLHINALLEKKVQDRTHKLQTANERLEKVNDDLSQMEQSRRLLLANIAHDLGTPVTVIHGYVQGVKEGLIPTNDSHYLGMVRDKIKLLNRLINDLFELSKIRPGQISLNRKEVDLGQWITEICSKFGLEITQTGRHFELAKPNKSQLRNFACYLDTDRMDQVFSNLVWNAIKHTPADGEISITAKLDKKSNTIIMAVRDNGHGMSDDVRPYIFNRFYKAATPSKETKVGSMGLGLAIVKEITLSHEGDVWATSKLNKGSTFFIRLPVYLKGGANV
ncbi:ATP-binding protein [Virgibacillus ndiopensis]|uniref:ATP-binding protein n=1 Tax=Virgibacillus ndiopensis TaxID=2004408 RepID=UPI000C07AC9C|nr:ATP-binding protein [Virgibacillus ndiopensis]